MRSFSRAFVVALAVTLSVQAGCRTTPCRPDLQAVQSTQLERVPSAGTPPEPVLDSPILPVAFAEESQEEIPSPPKPTAGESVLTLTAVLRLAVDANPDLTSAAEQIGVADAALARARAEFYPRLGISEQYGVSNNPVSAFTFQLSQAHSDDQRRGHR